MQMLENKALRVPETAKTCIEATLPATPVTVANEALTIGKDTSDERTTKILRSPSKLIKAKPVKLAPNLTIQLCHSSPNRIHKLPLTRQTLTFQLQS